MYTWCKNWGVSFCDTSNGSFFFVAPCIYELLLPLRILWILIPRSVPQPLACSQVSIYFPLGSCRFTLLADSHLPWLPPLYTWHLHRQEAKRVERIYEHQNNKRNLFTGSPPSPRIQRALLPISYSPLPYYPSVSKTLSSKFFPCFLHLLYFHVFRSSI